MRVTKVKIGEDLTDPDLGAQRGIIIGDTKDQGQEIGTEGELITIEVVEDPFLEIGNFHQVPQEDMTVREIGDEVFLDKEVGAEMRDLEMI